MHAVSIDQVGGILHFNVKDHCDLELVAESDSFFAKKL